MEYTHSTKCTFISATHSIFDFIIWGNFKTVICEGNLIINKRLDCNAVVCMKVQDVAVPSDEIKKAIDTCLERAKFIYEKK